MQACTHRHTHTHTLLNKIPKGIMYPYAANHHIICLHTHIKLKTFCYISIIMTFLSRKVFKGRKTLHILQFIDTLKSIQKEPSWLEQGAWADWRKESRNTDVSRVPRSCQSGVCWSHLFPFFVYYKTSGPSCKEGAFFLFTFTNPMQAQQAWTGLAIMPAFNCVPKQKAGIPSHLLGHQSLFKIT